MVMKKLAIVAKSAIVTLAVWCNTQSIQLVYQHNIGKIATIAGKIFAAMTLAKIGCAWLYQYAPPTDRINHHLPNAQTNWYDESKFTFRGPEKKGTPLVQYCKKVGIVLSQEFRMKIAETTYEQFSSWEYFWKSISEKQFKRIPWALWMVLNPCVTR